MGEKTIRVEENVWYALMNIKLERRMKNLNDVIKYLLRHEGREVSADASP